MRPLVLLGEQTLGTELGGDLGPSHRSVTLRRRLAAAIHEPIRAPHRLGRLVALPCGSPERALGAVATLVGERDGALRGLGGVAGGGLGLQRLGGRRDQALAARPLLEQPALTGGRRLP